MKRNAISLFTGIGALDLGLERAGFRIALAVECDPHAVQVLSNNRRWPIARVNGSPARIEEMSSAQILEATGCGAGELDLLVGGPPCQPFSKAGYWFNGDSGRLQDPRASTVREFFRVLRDVRPRAFLLENVPGFAFSAKSEAVRYVFRKLREINRRFGTNYGATIKEMNAADYGVPQLRRRVFVVGDREGRQFQFPEPTHSSLGPLRWITAWDVLYDMPPNESGALRVTGRWTDLLPSIPEGRNYLFLTDKGGGMPLFGWRTRYWSFLLKLAKSSPSWTLQAQPGPACGPFHWENRRLAPREMCRLQTIPDSYGVPEDIRTSQRLIGNAVPPVLGEILGLAIRRQLFNERVAAVPAMIPRACDIPYLTGAIRRVPRKYWILRGTHSAHPGTGLGPKALARNRSTIDDAVEGTIRVA